MKRFIALLTFACAASAQAAPHLYGTVQDGVTHCGVVIDGAPKVTVPVIQGSTPLTCRLDLASLGTGPHVATMTAIIDDPVWGTQESAPSAPFSFTRPAAPAAPSTPHLAP